MSKPAMDESEFPFGEFDDGRHWTQLAELPYSPMPMYETDPDGPFDDEFEDFEYTDEDLEADLAHMAEVDAREDAWVRLCEARNQVPW